MVVFWKDILKAGAVVLAIALLNLVGFIEYSRIDLTENGAHSLTPGFVQLLEDDLDHNMYVRVYLSGNDFPAQVENLRRNVEDKLIEFNHLSSGKVKYEFIDPEEDPELAEDLKIELEKAGLSEKSYSVLIKNKPVDIPFWPGAIIDYGLDKTSAIQFVTGGMESVDPFTLNLASDQLEYKFLQTFRKLTRDAYPKVGFLQGHGELPENSTISIRGHLKEYYDVEYFSLKDSAGRVLFNPKTDSTGKTSFRALKDYKSIVIAQPKSSFSNGEKFIIDQFIMNGGKVAWLVDALDMREDSLFMTGQSFALPYELNISDMLFNYGARLNNDLVLSSNCGPIWDFRKNQPAEWNFYVLARNSNRDPVASNLNPVKMKYASSVEPVGDTSIRKRILLESSQESRVFKSPARVALAYIDPAYRPKYIGNGVEKRPLAVMLEGRFKSFFRNSLDPAYKDSIVLKKESVPNKMLVIGDGDIIENRIHPKKVNKVKIEETDVLSPDHEVIVSAPNPIPMYDNIDFFKNAFDDLMEEDNLISLRGREFKQRPLNEKIVSNENSRNTLKFINVALPILILLIFGSIQYVVRKRKFAKP